MSKGYVQFKLEERDGKLIVHGKTPGGKKHSASVVLPSGPSKVTELCEETLKGVVQDQLLRPIDFVAYTKNGGYKHELHVPSSESEHIEEFLKNHGVQCQVVENVIGGDSANGVDVIKLFGTDLDHVSKLLRDVAD